MLALGYSGAVEQKPRQQLYTFEHRLLPDLILRNWPNVRLSFVDGTAVSRLRAIWNRIGEKLPPGERLDLAEYISVESITLGDGKGFLVGFPPPQQATEAALAIVPDLAPSTNYFVVEYGFSPVTKRPYWVLCAWKLESGGMAHVNMGAAGTEGEPDISKVLPDVIRRVRDVLDIDKAQQGQARH